MMWGEKNGLSEKYCIKRSWIMESQRQLLIFINVCLNSKFLNNLVMHANVLQFMINFLSDFEFSPLRT